MFDEILRIGFFVYGFVSIKVYSFVLKLRFLSIDYVSQLLNRELEY